MPRVVAVSLSPRHGFSKQPQPSIALLAGLGVDGDAHCGATVQHLYLKRKNAAAPNRMQVHLLQAELLDELAGQGFSIEPGALGENILTRGVDLPALSEGARLHLGSEAVVELTCLRQPCKQIDGFQAGLQQWMHAAPGSPVRYRVGVMGVVVQGGTVRPDDPCTVVPPPVHRALRK